ncbi:MAG: hypothetical protein HY886_07110 [Deltaproteobacteria bacterium]|nr:hypothetical protein [Deltaproteobacteria bacterium]
MKRVYLYVIFLIALISSPAVVFAQFYQEYNYLDDSGIYDDGTNAFYFEGVVYNSWTNKHKAKDALSENSLYKYDFTTGVMSKIYTDGRVAPLAPEGTTLSASSLSPDSNLIAFFDGIIKGDDVDHDLVVITKVGAVLHRVGGRVLEYAWTGDSSKLVYSTGYRDWSTEANEIVPDGVWFYDLSTKTKTKIGEKGWDFVSVPYDDKVYFTNDVKLLRYDPFTNAVEESKMEIANLSSDKRYYVDSIDIYSDNVKGPPYYSPFRIFDIKENRYLRADEILFISERDPGDFIWGKDTKTVIFDGNISRTDYTRNIYTYDFVNKKVIRQFTGKLIGINNAHTKLVILRDGKIVLESVQ